MHYRHGVDMWQKIILIGQIRHWLKPNVTVSAVSYTHFNELLDHYDDRLFSRMAFSNHCLHHLLEPDSSTSQMTLRTRGHSFNLPRFHFDLTKKSFIFRSFCMVLFSFDVEVFVENACVCIRLIGPTYVVVLFIWLLSLFAVFTVMLLRWSSHLSMWIKLILSYPFGMEKLEWLGYATVKKFRRYLYSFWRNSWTWQTDGRTDRRTPRDGIGRAYA